MEPWENLQADQRRTILERALRKATKCLRDGKVASYIPELMRADAEQLGLCVMDETATPLALGDADVPFTIQSIGKVAALLLALEKEGYDEVFARIGMEPSGAPFSEFTTLGDFSDKPSNPFINSGAIVLSSLLAADMDFAAYLDYLRSLCGNPGLSMDEAVFASECAHSDRNHSLAWELKHLQLLSSDLDGSLDFYTRLCSVSVTATDLARFAWVLAHGGKDPQGRTLIAADNVVIALSLMMTCGLYNGSGEFAVRSGMPAKSGVGGGIMAVLPGELGIGVFGPALDRNGNSIGGIALLEELSRSLHWHAFRVDEYSPS